MYNSGVYFDENSEKSNLKLVVKKDKVDVSKLKIKETLKLTELKRKTAANYQNR